MEYVQLSELDRMRYDSTIARVRDDNTRISSARMDAEEIGLQKGFQSAHIKALERFQKQALKRFPALSPATEQAVFMLNEEQLDKQMRMIFKYPDQKSFEIELPKIADAHR